MNGEARWLGQTGYLTLTSPSENVNVNQVRIIVNRYHHQPKRIVVSGESSSSPEHHHHQSHPDLDIIVIINQPCC